MAIQEINNNDDALDVRNKINNNFKEIGTLIDYNIQNTFIEVSTSNTKHIFNIEGIQSYADIENKLLAFIVTQATGTSHTFNINSYGDTPVQTFDTLGNPRNLTTGELVAGKIILAFRRNNTFYLINNNPQVATEAQAKAGTLDNVYMTPSKTKNVLDSFSVNFVNGSTGSFVKGNCTIVTKATKAQAATYGGNGKVVILIGGTG